MWVMKTLLRIGLYLAFGAGFIVVLDLVVRLL